MSPVQNLELNVRFFPFRREVKRIRMMSKRRWQRSRPNFISASDWRPTDRRWAIVPQFST
jgi:hypothetical protein